jgi:hypothetical protein
MLGAAILWWGPVAAGEGHRHVVGRRRKERQRGFENTTTIGWKMGGMKLNGTGKEGGMRIRDVDHDNSWLGAWSSHERSNWRGASVPSGCHKGSRARIQRTTLRCNHLVYSLVVHRVIPAVAGSQGAKAHSGMGFPCDWRFVGMARLPEPVPRMAISALDARSAIAEHGPDRQALHVVESDAFCNIPARTQWRCARNVESRNSSESCRKPTPG